MDSRIFYNPLAVLGKWRGFVAAIVVVVILGVVAYWGGVHIGEALTPSITPDPPTIGAIALESLIGWLSLGIFFFLASKAFRGNSGIGAHLGAAGLGRFPLVIAAVLLSRGVLGEAMLKVKMPATAGVAVPPSVIVTPAVIMGVVVMFALVAWAMVILYLGFLGASKIARSRALIAFISGAALAQLTSHLLMNTLR